MRAAPAAAALGALGAGALAAAATIDDLDVTKQRGHYSLEANAYLDATREVLQKHGSLWFQDESYVVSRKRD